MSSKRFCPQCSSGNVGSEVSDGGEIWVCDECGFSDMNFPRGISHPDDDIDDEEHEEDEMIEKKQIKKSKKIKKKGKK